MIEQVNTSLKWLLSAKNQVLYQRPRLPEAEIIRLLGGGTGGKASPRIRKNIARWTKSLASVISPRLVFSTHRISSTDGREVRLENGATLRSPKLARAFSNCEFLVCFVGTAGKSIEDEINGLSEKGKVSEAFVVEAIGSVAAETMIERFHEGALQHSGALSYGTTLRFSPGYCDWSVREQMTLFRLVNAKSIGVSLSANALMSPRKSVSGVFGFAPGVSSVQFPYNPCHFCGNKDCFSRRATKATPTAGQKINTTV